MIQNPYHSQYKMSSSMGRHRYREGSLLSLTAVLSPSFVSFYISTDFVTAGAVQHGPVWTGEFLF